MGRTYRGDGNVLDLIAPMGGVTVDVPYMHGDLFVVPKVTAAAGDTFAAIVAGVVELPKKSTDSWGEGDLLYFDEADEEITDDPDGGTNPPVGTAASVAANPSATALVKLSGVPKHALASPAGSEEIEADAVTIAKVGGAGFAAGPTTYDHASVGATTLVPAAAVGDRLVQGVAIVSELFAGTSTLPVIQVGQTGTAGKFLEVGEGKTIDGSEAVRIPFHGVLTDNTALIVTVANGTGGSEAGKLTVSVQLLPLPSA